METLAGTTTFVLHKVAVASRRAIAARLAERPGLTLWEYAALAELTDQGAVAQNVLAGALGIDTSDMVRLMDDLIAKELVARDRDPADRRRYRIGLTAKGRRSNRDCAEGDRRGRAGLVAAAVGDRAGHAAGPGERKSTLLITNHHLYRPR